MPPNYLSDSQQNVMGDHAPYSENIRLIKPLIVNILFKIIMFMLK